MIYIYIYIQDALWEALWQGRWGLSNNAGHNGWPTTKKLKKKHWLKRSKTVPLKSEISAKINNSKFYIWNSFFENIFLGIQLFYIRPHVPVDIIRVFFYFRFSNRKSQSQQKLAKKITHCTIQLHAKNLTYFMNPNSVDIESNMPPQRSQKPLTLQLFQQTCFCLV